MFRQQPGTRGEHLVTGRDVTPNLLTHLASPDAQVIHRHSLASQLLMPFHASRIIAKPSLSASVEEGKQEGPDQKPRSQFAPTMEWSQIYYMVAFVQVNFFIATDTFKMCHHSIALCVRHHRTQIEVRDPRGRYKVSYRSLGCATTPRSYTL